MVRPVQFLGPLQGYQPTLPTPSSRTLRVPTQPRAPELASDLRSSLAMHVLDHGRLLAADDPSTSPDAANALLPMSVRQNDCVLLIDGLNGERTEHETMVFYDRQCFFTFLVLMTRIAEAEAHFFTTVLEPSPWRTEVSS